MSLPESMGTKGVPYPPERYDGEAGEVSALEVRVQPAALRVLC